MVCYNTRLPTTGLPRFTGKVREQRILSFPKSSLVFQGVCWFERCGIREISVAFVRGNCQNCHWFSKVKKSSERASASGYSRLYGRAAKKSGINKRSICLFLLRMFLFSFNASSITTLLAFSHSQSAKDYARLDSGNPRKRCVDLERTSHDCKSYICRMRQFCA